MKVKTAIYRNPISHSKTWFLNNCLCFNMFLEVTLTLNAWLLTSLAWNRDRNGGSKGFPRYRGTGIPSAITLKSSLTRTRRHRSISSWLYSY